MFPFTDQSPMSLIKSLPRISHIIGFCTQTMISLLVPGFAVGYQKVFSNFTLGQSISFQLAEIRSLSLGWEIHTPSPPSQTWYIFLWQKIGFFELQFGQCFNPLGSDHYVSEEKNFCWDGTPDASFQRCLSVLGLLSISEELDWCSQQTPHIITTTNSDHCNILDIF